MLDFIAFAISGKILIYTIQKFPFFIWIGKKISFVNQLISCDFCLGVWVYCILNLVSFRLSFYNANKYDIISGIVTGIATSFVMHLISVGWMSKYAVYIVDGKE